MRSWIEARSLRDEAPWLAVAAATLVAFAFLIHSEFATPENLAAPSSGPPGRPTSDALGPWLQGGLTFLFGQPPPDYLYRPTVGVFWALDPRGHHSVPMIPAFFTAMLFGTFAACALLGVDARIRNGVIVGLAICVVGFEQTWAHTHFSSTNVDLPRWRSPRAGVLLPPFGARCLGVSGPARGLCLHRRSRRDPRPIDARRARASSPPGCS
jgi:hypothetical protein